VRARGQPQPHDLHLARQQVPGARVGVLGDVAEGAHEVPELAVLAPGLLGERRPHRGPRDEAGQQPPAVAPEVPGGGVRQVAARDDAGA
jgi:hypothetical protein